MKTATSERQDPSPKPSGIVGARPPSAAFGNDKKSHFSSGGKAAGDGRGPSEPGSALSSDAKPRKSRLWLWFVLAFILQLGAWVAWFTIANQHRVETVPLVNTGAMK